MRPVVLKLSNGVPEDDVLVTLGPKGDLFLDDVLAGEGVILDPEQARQLYAFLRGVYGDDNG